MNRAEKLAQIEKMNQDWQPARNAFLVGFSGLTVAQVTDLRRKIRDASSSYTVVKNRLARRASDGTPLEAVADRFTGPTAVAYNDNDPVQLAKLLTDFAKDNPALSLRVGLVDGKEVIEEEGIKALAKLPGLDELRAQLLSVFLAPATQLVRLIGTPGTQIAQVVAARQAKLEEEGS